MQSLNAAPHISGGGCGFARHGTYRRKTRWGDALIPRWYCPDAHMTWSLLARCFAARLPGTLDDLEAAALAAETEPGLRAAAECARPGHAVTEAANRRWLKCIGATWSRACLVAVTTLLPDLSGGCPPSVIGTQGASRDRAAAGRAARACSIASSAFGGSAGLLCPD